MKKSPAFGVFPQESEHRRSPFFHKQVAMMASEKFGEAGFLHCF
jgi:hypothetical protein